MSNIVGEIPSLQDLKIKLIIWDLDETLWSGILAEGDEIGLFENRADFIQKINNKGIVNAICSKNDFEEGERKLKQLGLWEEFVFPRIEFNPKGPIVKWIIENMQLRAENVVFVDDNHTNLMEVKHFSPEITVVNATLPGFDGFLDNILEKNKNVEKSRIAQYRILESKLKDKEDTDISNEEFLESCEIKIMISSGNQNTAFIDRIEELINRTNQLNFTNSRVEEGVLEPIMVDIGRYESWSIFVWDKYGEYGLVGFCLIDYEKGRFTDVRLEHLVFSCRIMNMGVEQHIMSKICEKFPNLNPIIESSEKGYLEEVDFSSEQGKNALDSMMGEVAAKDIRFHIMANCQSGLIGHYMGATRCSEIDQWPSVYVLGAEGKYKVKQAHESAEIIIFGVFNDYSDLYWDPPATGDSFTEKLNSVLSRWKKDGKEVCLILPADDLPDEAYNGINGVTKERFVEFNGICNELAGHYDMRTVNLSDFVNKGEIIQDARHYPRYTWEALGKQLREIYD